jgi:signal transduction histidine kinase
MMQLYRKFISNNRALLISVGVLFITVIASSVYLTYTLVTTRSFIHKGTNDVTSYIELQNLLLTVRTAEDGQRGYVIAGQQAYLQPYLAAQKEIPVELAAINKAPDLSPWKKEVTALDNLVNNRMGKLSTGISLRNTSGLDAFAAAIQVSNNTTNGEAIMDQIQADTITLETAELQKLTPQYSQAADNIHRSIIVTPVIVLLVLAICVIIIIYFQEVINKERTVEGAKNEFLSLASHQLRTPATNVKQYLGLLLEGYFGDLDKEQLSAIKIANKNNEIEINIMNELLNITKLDLDKISMNLKPTDVAPLIQYVVNDYAPKIKARKQKLTFKAQKKMYVALLDSIYFRTVIENLLDNASKYTRDGGRIRIILDKVENNVVISIKDNGIGIRKNDLPRLFKKFSRIQNELSHSVDGSGLGLYWVQRIVELHQGKISVVSEPGKGSDFRITLPLVNSSRLND